MCDVRLGVCKINDLPNKPSIRRRTTENLGLDTIGEVQRSRDKNTSKHYCFIEEIKCLLPLT